MNERTPGAAPGNGKGEQQDTYKKRVGPARTTRAALCRGRMLQAHQTRTGPGTECEKMACHRIRATGTGLDARSAGDGHTCPTRRPDQSRGKIRACAHCPQTTFKDQTRPARTQHRTRRSEADHGCHLSSGATRHPHDREARQTRPGAQTKKARLSGPVGAAVQISARQQVTNLCPPGNPCSGPAPHLS